MLIKRIVRSKKDFSDGWKQMIFLVAEIHQEKENYKVRTIEQSPMGRYIKERVCRNATEALFVAEEYIA